MFHGRPYNEHTVYPTTVNKTLQSFFFLLRVRESWCLRELGLSHCKQRLSVNDEHDERDRRTGRALVIHWNILGDETTPYSHIIHGQFVPTLTFCWGYDRPRLVERTRGNAAAELESWRRTVCVDCWLWGEPVVPSISYSWAKWFMLYYSWTN